MARAKRLWRAVPRLSPRVWATWEEAYLRIKSQVGVHDLVLHDLCGHLLEGRNGWLDSAVRLLPFHDANDPRLSESTARYRIKTPVCGVLKPSFWSRCRLSATGVAAVPKEMALAGRRYFFVRRKQLDKLYPLTSRTEHVSGSSPSPSSPPRGRPVQYDWLSIDAEIVRRCLERMPEKQYAFVAEIQAWCKETGRPVPSPTELNPRIQVLRAVVQNAKNNYRNYRNDCP
jgi:hypothetical protein